LDTQRYAAYLLDGTVRGKPHVHQQACYGHGNLQRAELHVLDYTDLTLSTIVIRGILKTTKLDSKDFELQPKPKAKPKPEAQSSASALDVLADEDDDFKPSSSKPVSSHSHAGHTCLVDGDLSGIIDAGGCIEELVADTLGLDDAFDMPIDELGSASCSDMVGYFRAQVKAETDMHELVVNSDSDGGHECGTVSVRKKAISKRKAVHPQQVAATEGVCGLHALLEAATKDQLEVCQMSGLAWEQMELFRSGVPRTKIGQLCVVSENPKLILRAECRMHANCMCWIDIDARPGGRHAVQESLISWLSTASSLSSEAHALHAKSIKQSFGIKPRG